MTTTNEQLHPFITYLESLVDDRGALAALRRGLGRQPGEAAEMFPYIVPWLPERISRDGEAAYYLIASLFAYHPDSAAAGNMGAHLARPITSEQDRPSVERRFTQLMAAHADDLPVVLRQAVSFLKSKEVPVNWHQLFRDINYWDHPDRFVQKAWANAFWGRRSEPAGQESEPTESQP